MDVNNYPVGTSRCAAYRSTWRQRQLLASGGWARAMARRLRSSRAMTRQRERARSRDRDGSRVAVRPEATTLDGLRRESTACRGCDLYKRATQTVFGEGASHARIVLVGEQPGNDEDLAGRPFVGPAGRVLDEALAQAGIERRSLYVTNAVKHFKWASDDGGKRRIHDKPRADEVEACRPWLERELWLIEPRVIVCLGVTAARSVVGRGVTISTARGRPLPSRFGVPAFVTAHPSAILRMRERADREAALARFVADLDAACRAAGLTPHVSKNRIEEMKRRDRENVPGPAISARKRAVIHEWAWTLLGHTVCGATALVARAPGGSSTERSGQGGTRWLSTERRWKKRRAGRRRAGR